MMMNSEQSDKCTKAAAQPQHSLGEQAYDLVMEAAQQAALKEGIRSGEFQRQLLAAQAAIAEIYDLIKDVPATGESAVALGKIDQICESVDLSALEKHDAEVRKDWETVALANKRDAENYMTEALKVKPLVDALEKLQKRVLTREQKAIVDDALAKVGE
jgi:hypothetical protein